MPTLEYSSTGDAQPPIQRPDERYRETGTFSESHTISHSDADNSLTKYAPDANSYEVMQADSNNINMSTYYSRVPEDIQRAIFDCEKGENWDLEDADAITKSACDSAIRFLATLLEKNPNIPKPQVSPSVFGAVTLEWSISTGDIAVRIFSSNDKVFFRSEEAGTRLQGELVPYVAIMRVSNFLKLFYA